MATVTTVRGGPNLTIAATQNTAPVYEFRCLYTHDLRKKKKLWHDGSLRYHTFNKRVMVYDDSKNYIGDSHWREAEELQDGAELKLDKGVLVDVGERIGETLTDLAPLLEKRRPESGSSLPHPLRPISLAVTSRIATSITQARPKSLSDVLGISQGPIGRARFPNQSPYEQLHIVAGQSSHHQEPPAKKLRLGSDKENVDLRRDKYVRRERLPRTNASVPVGRFDASASSGLRERRQTAIAKEVIHISSEDEAISLSSSTPRSVSEVKAGSRRALDLDGRLTVSPKTVASLESLAAEPKLQASEPVTVRSLISLEKSATKLLLSTSSSKSKLRLAAHKPRKKLMYKEPSLSSNNRKSQLQTADSPSANRGTPAQRQQRSPTRNENTRLASGYTFSDIEKDGAHGNFPEGKTASMTEHRHKKLDVERDLAELLTQSLSPLFMPESPARAAMDVTEPENPDEFPSAPLAAALTTNPAPRHPLLALSVTTPHMNNAPLPLPASKLTLLDRQLMMAPSKNAAYPLGAEREASNGRSLRRVLSENDSPGYGKPEMALKSVHQELSKAMSPSKSETAHRQPFKSPMKLTKSLSDTAARPRVHQPRTASTTKKDTVQDSGAWSKVESYLLLDWYPPGRERLMLDAKAKGSSGIMVVKRGLLFDQIDAL